MVRWKAMCWRLLSPLHLAGAAILFFLPWINVRCDSKYSDGSTGSEKILSQSGWDAAWGKVTVLPLAGDGVLPGASLVAGMYQNSVRDKLLQENSPARLLASYHHGNTNKRSTRLAEGEETRNEAIRHAQTCQPLLVTYAILLAVGILGGILLPLGRFRLLVLMVMAAAALGVLTFHATEEPLLAAWVSAENQALRRVHEEFAPTSVHRIAPELALIFTWYFYGAFPLLAAALLLGVTEWLVRGTRGTAAPGQGVSA